jgi:ribonuclease HI
VQQDGISSAGMIIRRQDGSILLSSCRSLRHCGSALEAELCAFMEGVALATERCQEQILIETDSTEVVRLVTSSEQDQSLLNTGSRKLNG